MSEPFRSHLSPSKTEPVTAGRFQIDAATAGRRRQLAPPASAARAHSGRRPGPALPALAARTSSRS